jgi:hypothetical protein
MVGVVKRVTKYSVELWGEGRPLSVKFTGGPPSMVYVAQVALCESSVGTKP